MTTHERPFGRYLEDFEPGDILRHWPGKTITEYDDHLFCMITMNHHPLHTNDWFAAESVQGRNVVVGNLVYSLVLGMSVPDVSGAAIANLEIETLQHKFPTFHGDTIHAETRILEVKESSLKPLVSTVTTPRSGFDDDGLTSRTRVSAWIVSPWNVGNLCWRVSISRLAIAAPDTSGTLIPNTRLYTRLPTTTLRPCTDSAANQSLVCNGWWFIVIMQNRWSSYSVMVLPGQWRRMSPGVKSSR